MRYLRLNENALTIYFDDETSEHTRSRIVELSKALHEYPFIGFQESVPAYVSLTVFYDPFKIQFQEVEKHIKQLVKTSTNTPDKHQNTKSDIIQIPVCYGGKYGPDLAFVASHNHLTENEVIQIHSSAIYTVNMIGFMPGFAYLSGLPSQIAAPRLPIPRPNVYAGSVGIAGRQTGIYPLNSPGGWQIIGKTPFTMFDIYRHPPSLLKAGQLIQFVPIDLVIFESLKQK